MIGQTISHYRIVGKTGAGGRHEVYRASGTKLNREVAIKVLSDALAHNSERKDHASLAGRHWAWVWIH